MILDAHQHFWIYDEKQYPWIPKGSPLHRNWLPPDWQEAAKKCGVTGSIAVQARQTLEESRWLLELSEKYSTIKGVVGWVDLRSENVSKQLAEFARHSKFVGVRHVVQDEPDPEFMLRPDFLRGVRLLKEFELVYDILIFPTQVPAAIDLVNRFPAQQFVLDHIAKPLIKDGVLSPWREQIRELAKAPNIVCKVSGMVTEAKPKAWNRTDFKPYLDVIFDAFGVDRLLFGSDWPVCLLAGSYTEVFELLTAHVSGFSEADRAKILGMNAVEIYLRSAGCGSNSTGRAGN